jgi:hypothetical protein
MIRRHVPTPRRTLTLHLAVISAVLTLVATLTASGPVFWTTLGAGDLLRGTSEGVFVSLDGVVTAGPQLTARLTSTPAQIWSLAAGPDGTLWAGTGGDGRLVRIRPGQAEETVATTKETGVFAVAVAGARVYYGTAPDGRVYVADGTAAPRVFFDPQEKYIWALAVDGSGRLWVGAGTPAVIYRVDADGTSRFVYRPPAAHVVSLAVDSRGNVLAGTESPGRLYQFDSSDRPHVLLDTEMTELRAIAPGRDGSIFVAAVSRGDDAAPAGGESTSIAAALPAPPSTGSPGSPSGGSASSSAPSRRSAVFRIDPSGSWETFWDTQDTVYDLAADADGGVLAASGPEGRLYKITRTQQVHLLTGVDAKQITRIVTAPGGLISFATANPGRIISASAATQSPATYLSPVRDTKSASTWGTIRWESTAGVELFSRSGNTEKTDDTWSEWAGPYTRREGETIKSPPARYLQWKSVLTRSASATAPQLTSVTVAYLPRNTRPIVSAITVYPPGVVFQRPFAGDDSAIAGLDDATADARRPPGDAPPAPSPGKRMYQKGLQTLTWKADDNDGDRLSFAVFYRREGDAAWREMKADWGDSIVVWDTTSVADGRYIVKVVASDLPSNAGDRALTGERESTLVDVDNTPPVLSTEVQRQAGAIHLLVRAHDAQSAIAKLEYSLGGGRWVAVYPVDGTADSPDERFDITVASDADLARMVIRAFDTLQNVATQPAVVR